MFASGVHIFRLRLSSLKSGATRRSFYRSYRQGEEPEKIAVATRHYSNLFKTPVLFYMGCLTTAVLGPADLLVLAAAWLFVVLRIIQSLIHLTTNNVKQRAYSFSQAVLCFWLCGSASLPNL